MTGRPRSLAERFLAWLGARLAGAIQLEDVLLFLWFALGEPLFERLLGGLLPEDLAAAIERGGQPVLGLALLVAGGCAVVCLATRDVAEETVIGDIGEPEGPEEADVREVWERPEDSDAPAGRHWLTPSTYARLPMLVVLAMLADRGFEQFGSEAGGRLFPWIVVFVGATLLVQPWLPVLPYLVRRLLMAPTVVLGALLFTDTMESLFGGASLAPLAQGGSAHDVAAAQFGATIVVVTSLLYYVLFVFAPRQVAGGGSWWFWLLRYALFLSALLGSLIWGLPGPSGP